MKSFRYRLLIAAVAVLFGTAIAKSQTAEEAPPPPPMHGHEFGMEGGPMMGFFARSLNLTDEQKTQMKSIMEKEHPTITPLVEQQRQIDVQLRQYVEGTFDEAKVHALAVQKSQVEAELTVQDTRVHNELYQVLTTDQRSQLKEIEAKHEARMQQHMHDTPPPPAEE